MSRQRRLILDQLRADGGHPTADELYQRVREQLPRISLGTVYRNLDVLGELGLVAKVFIPSRATRYDADRSPHTHIRCVGCGKVDDLRIEPDETLIEQVSRQTRQQVQAIRLEADGLCNDCRRQGRGPAEGSRNE